MSRAFFFRQKFNVEKHLVQKTNRNFRNVRNLCATTYADEMKRKNSTPRQRWKVKRKNEQSQRGDDPVPESFLPL